MNLTGIDTSQLINQTADSEIVIKELLGSSTRWDKIPISNDNQVYFATLNEHYPGPNISRETVFAKKLDPKFPDSHEACDFYIIEINFWKYDDEKPNAKFEIAHGVKTDFTPQQTIALLGRPTNDDGNDESYHWEYTNYDLNISFEGRVYSAIVSSNTSETLKIIDLTMAMEKTREDNKKAIKPEKYRNPIDTSKFPDTEWETVSETDNKNAFFLIGFIVCMFAVAVLFSYL